MGAALEQGMKRPHPRLISTLTNGKANGPKQATKRTKMSPHRVHAFVESLVADHMHAKRVLSMSGGVVGVLHAASLGVHAIGLGLAEVVGLQKEDAVKQVDRLLSNRGIDVWEEFTTWVPFVLGARTEALVALD